VDVYGESGYLKVSEKYHCTRDGLDTM
jgi:hypothetical protein